MIVYDLETKRAVPDRKLPNIVGIEYCQGWDDHAGMGIAVVCTYDTQKQKYGVYCEDNREDFYELVSREVDTSTTFVSYNGLSFDNKVIKACWNMFIPYSQCYDVLVEIWQAHGLGPTFQYPTHAGFSLDDVASTNNLGVKSMNGAMAPVMWQRGEVGRVITYCLEDVRLTTRLLRRAVEGKSLISPKTGAAFMLRSPLNGKKPN
jgi:hypothetical protein